MLLNMKQRIKQVSDQLLMSRTFRHRDEERLACGRKTRLVRLVDINHEALRTQVVVNTATHVDINTFSNLLVQCISYVCDNNRLTHLLGQVPLPPQPNSKCKTHTTSLDG